jgi:hypothetical protein
MRRLVRLTLVLAIAAAFGAGVRPTAAVACAQDAAGRCERSVACSPPAEGRCTTVVANPLSKLTYSCRCITPRSFGPSGGSGNACRQRCSTSNLTCEGGARTNTQHSSCASRAADCNSHCQ